MQNAANSSVYPIQAAVLRHHAGRTTMSICAGASLQMLSEFAAFTRKV
ncbi:hypothetical protein [Alistipes finegoldii]|nr:hypothetical protein [Alistipes finegoldii]